MGAEMRLGGAPHGSITLSRLTEPRRAFLACLGEAYYNGVGFSSSGMNEVVVRVDEKGRVVIPSDIRRRLNIGKMVRISVKGDEITLRPVDDPLRSLEGLVIKGTRDVESDIGRLRRAAERELERGTRCRPH